jgi:hypothetical protein
MSHDNDRSPLAERLERLSHKALAKLAEIVDAPHTKNDPNHVAVWRLRADVAKTILIAQIRADKTKLRAGPANNIQAILEAVLRRKAELAEEEAVELRRLERSILDPDDDGFDE